MAAPKDAPPAADSRVRWDKAACRFCGTGCSVLVGVQDGRVVATQGDPDAPVNRGLNCIKGYFLSKIMYGEDRLTRPLLRMKDGKYDKNGEFTPITWNQAFDIMAEKWKTALKADGPNGIAMFGSGQWTIFEGYAASKLMKAGFRSNNLDPNARHCMASAVTGFMRTFGMDEPMGCYDDIEQADAFVLWGSNMAEMHPVLWSRITDRRLSNPNTRVVVLSTFEHRSFDLADMGMIFTPQTDLAILNYIANYLITNKKVDTEFVKKNVNFKKGADDIGYGLRPAHALEKDAKSNGYAGADGKPKRSRIANISLLLRIQLRRLLRVRVHRSTPTIMVLTFGFASPRPNMMMTSSKLAPVTPALSSLAQAAAITGLRSRRSVIMWLEPMTRQSAVESFAASSLTERSL